MLSRSMVSNAFEKSTKISVAGSCLSRTPSRILRRARMWATVPLSGVRTKVVLISPQDGLQ